MKGSLKRNRLTEIEERVTRLFITGVGTFSIDSEGNLSDDVTDVDYSNGSLRVTCGSGSVMNIGGGMIINSVFSGGNSQIVCGNMSFQSSGSQWTARNMNTGSTMTFDSSFNNIKVNGQRVWSVPTGSAVDTEPSKTFRIKESSICYIELSSAADLTSIPAKFLNKQSLSIVVSGSGTCDLTELTMDLDSLECMVSGSGDIKGSRDFKANILKATIHGSGDITGFVAKKECICKIYGSGDIECYALQGAEKTKTIHGSGDIDIRKVNE